MNMRKLIGLTGLMIVLASCSDPQVVIHGPNDGDTFVTEGMIPIHATATDPDGLNRVSIKIENHIHDFWPAGATTYEFTQSETMTSHQDGYVVVITVEAEDMHGNIGSEKVGVLNQ